MHSVTLYHWEPNAHSGKPMLALMEKGVAFNSHYLAMSIEGEGPVLVAEGRAGNQPLGLIRA